VSVSLVPPSSRPGWSANHSGTAIGVAMATQRNRAEPLCSAGLDLVDRTGDGVAARQDDRIIEGSYEWVIEINLWARRPSRRQPTRPAMSLVRETGPGAISAGGGSDRRSFRRAEASTRQPS